MPLYDYQCDNCDHVFEIITASNDEKPHKCPRCGKRKAYRIISVSGTNCANEDAGWIRSVTDVVPKGADATPMDREFAKNPTRSNYKRWMKSRGLRPLENGEGPSKPKAIDAQRLAEKVWRKRMARNRIELGG